MDQAPPFILLGLAAIGIMQTSALFRGKTCAEVLHTNAACALITLHVLGVAVASLERRENYRSENW